VTAPVVVHVATTDMSLELLLGPQLSALAAAGFRVVGASAPGEFVPALQARGVEHIPLAHATRAMSPAEDARALRELTRLFRRLRPAIVHTHNPKPGLYGRIAAKVARVPAIVNTVHGIYALPTDPLLRRSAVYMLERVAALCSDAELVQNEEDMDVLRRLRVPARKLVLLGNGIDLQRFDPTPFDADARAAARTELGATEPGDVVVGTVARLVVEKGYRELFEAARRLRTSAPAARVAAIGFEETDKADALGPDDMAAAKADGVHFLGARHDVDRLLAGMDVFVLASHREGYPRSAMEAAAMGLPIVATDIRGCRQVIEHGVTGLLVRPRDPAALADAVARLVTDADLRASMGTAARERATRLFDQQRCIDTTLSVYRRLLTRRGIALPAGSTT
jgi:glycosyltransferase involved in cell wall biosynthesis